MYVNHLTVTVTGVGTNLSIGTLQNELQDVCPKWFTFGIQLGIKIGTLQCIEQNWCTDVTRCLVELLIVWLKGNPSWKDIVKALRSNAMGEQSLADGIEGNYCSCDHRLSQSAPTSSPPSWKWAEPNEPGNKLIGVHH